MSSGIESTSNIKTANTGLSTRALSPKTTPATSQAAFTKYQQSISSVVTTNHKQTISHFANQLSHVAVDRTSKSEEKVTTPVQTAVSTEPQKSIVQVLVWHKGSGKDVGHTAVRINDQVYGYYPSDTNENNVYDNRELWSSKGELHLDSLVNFKKKYSGDTLDVFTLDGSKEKLKKLENYYKSLEKTPGKYNLLLNQCTTTAMRGLREADYFDVLYATAPEALSTKLKLLNKLGMSGVDKITTIRAENLK